jgi:MFS family permease
VRTYRELFAVREFRAIFGAQCLTMASGAIGGLALATITYRATGSPVLSGLSMFGGPLVRLLASWFLSAASDLLRPRVALAASTAISFLAALLQATPAMPWGGRMIILALPWVAMAATGGAAPALVADILPANSFVFGRSTLNVAIGGMQIVGYAIADVLLTRLSTTALFLCSAAASLAALMWVLIGVADHPARTTTASVARRAHAVNRALLSSRLIRPIFLASWIPNGLVVGCESLFVPLAGRYAGYLFSATAAGMLIGDVSVGRFVPERIRDRLVGPLRFLLAAPYLLFLTRPPIVVGAALGFVASIGYAASLPLQERLVTNTEPAVRGQLLGLNSAGVTAMQGVGAAVAGALAQWFGGGSPGAATAMGVAAAASICVSVALIPGLQRSRIRRSETTVAEPAPPLAAELGS